MAILFNWQPLGKCVINARGGHVFLREIPVDRQLDLEELMVVIENDAPQLPTVDEFHAGFRKAGCPEIPLTAGNIAFGVPADNWRELYFAEPAEVEEVPAPQPVEEAGAIQTSQASPEESQAPETEHAEVEAVAEAPAETATTVTEEPAVESTREDLITKLKEKYPDDAEGAHDDLSLEEMKALLEIE